MGNDSLSSCCAAYWVKKAFREAVSPPTGPTAVAIPEELVFFRGTYQPMYGLFNGYVPGTWPIKDPARTRGGAHPAVVEEAMKWLLQAERPAMIVGEAIHYEDAEEELKEFVYLLGIPCHCRRMSRAAISEYDSLNCHGRVRGRVMRRADRAPVMGLRCGYLEW